MPYGGEFFLLLVSFTLMLQVVEHYKLLKKQQKPLSTRKTEWPVTGNCTTDTGWTGNASGLCSIESSFSNVSISKQKQEATFFHHFFEKSLVTQCLLKIAGNSCSSLREFCLSNNDFRSNSVCSYLLFYITLPEICSV